MAVRNPSGLMRAFGLALRVGWASERPLPVHLIYLLEACRIAIWLHDENVQHLHAHFGTNPAEVAMFVRELGGPTWSFTVHGPEEFDKPRFIALPEKIRSADFVVAVSSFGRSQLFRLTPHEDWGKIKVVHCGLERSFYATDAEKMPDPQRLVCIGRLCEQKGQLLLIEAVRQLKTQGIAVQLVLAGDGEMRREIEALVADYQLQDTVRITGWINSDRVREEILSARALILPSFAEGLPVVLMEAMALRRPVISTFIAGIPELVQPGEHGWLAPAGDVALLVAAMQACLAASPQTITKMGEAARTRALQRHDADTEAARLVELFALAGNPSVRARTP